MEYDYERSQFVQAFGQSFYMAGHKALGGQILALLLLHDDGVITLDEITEQLHVSKGPVSQVVRELCDQGLLQKTWNKGSRRLYFRLTPNAWSQSIRLLLQPLQNRLNSIQDLTQKLPLDKFAKHPKTQLARLLDVYRTFADQAERLLKQTEQAEQRHIQDGG